MATKPQDLSRRVFFRRVATCAVSAAIVQGLGPNLAEAQAKAEADHAMMEEIWQQQDAQDAERAELLKKRRQATPPET